MAEENARLLRVRKAGAVVVGVGRTVVGGGEVALIVMVESVRQS